MQQSRSGTIVATLALLVGAGFPACSKRQDPNSGELIQKQAQPAPIPHTTASSEQAPPSNSGNSRKPSLKDKGKQLWDATKGKVEDLKEAAHAKEVELAERMGNKVGIGDEIKRVVALTDEELAQYGRNIAYQMDSTYTIVGLEDPRARRLSALVSPHGNEDGLTLSVKLYDSPTINAFALPDGSIRFFTGLVESLTDDQLRAVFGHEVGHVARGHAKDRMRMALLAKAGGKLLLGEKPGIGDEILVLLGRAYVNAAYSRHNEIQADEYAHGFMVRHRYPEHALIEVFEKFEELERKHGRGIFTMFASHPPAKDRIEQAKDLVDKD